MLGEVNTIALRKTAIQLGLPVAFIVKDYHVTRAIHALTKREDEYFKLVFQGGTSLSKAYHVIQRLSEDIGFRIIQKKPMKNLGKNIRRKKLREFRYALIRQLEAIGLVINEHDTKVFYEGRYMGIKAQYADNIHSTYLKPHIAIDCFLGELLLESENKNITTLVKDNLGSECDHPVFSVACVSLEETAAEKWVALTRRIVGTQLKSRKSDKDLVRHLYDLYHLNANTHLTKTYRYLIQKIAQKDVIQFNDSIGNDALNPLKTSRKATKILLEDQRWQQHWDNFLEQMVYADNKPSFEQAVNNMQDMTNLAIEAS